MANMSFLPEDYLEKRIQRRTNIISLGLFLVVMAAVVGAFFVTDRQRSEIRAQQAQVNKQFEDAAAWLEQRDKLEERKAQIMHKARITSSLRERVHRSVVLAELINNMPGSVALLGLTLDTRVVKTAKPLGTTALDDAKRAAAGAGAPDADVQQTDVEIELEGVAPTDVQVAQFMTALSRSKLFTELNLAFSEEITVDDQKMRKFKVELKVNPEVDMQSFEPLMVKRDLERNPMDDAIVAVGPNGKLTTKKAVTMVPGPDGAPIPANSDGHGIVPASDRR